MKRSIALAFAGLLVLAAAAGAAAQTGALAGLLGPVLVTVDQAVPVSLTVATELDDGAVITSTVPLTVGVKLEISIAGDQVVALAAGASEAAVAVAALPTGETLSDNNDIPYTAEVPGQFALTQVRSGEDYGDDFAVIGEITNNDDDEYTYLQINITLYDAGGSVLDTANGYPELTPFEPGRTSAFEISTSIPFDDVARYRIQVQP